MSDVAVAPEPKEIPQELEDACRVLRSRAMGLRRAKRQTEVGGLMQEHLEQALSECAAILDDAVEEAMNNPHLMEVA